MTRKKLLKNLRKRSRRYANKRNRRDAGKQQVQIEQLEPRLMLTADLDGNRIEQLLSQYTADDFIQGFDSALVNLEETIDNAAAAVNEIPLIGDQLVSAVDPFLSMLGDMRESLRSNVEFAFAQAGADENASLLELYEGAIFQVFGPNGLNALQDGIDLGTVIDTTDVVRTSGIDLFTNGDEVEDSEWVQWNVRLAQQFHVDIPIDATIDFEALTGSDSLANLGFSIETTGSLRVNVDWEAYLGWGMTLGNELTGVEPGFFLDAAALDDAGEEVKEIRLTIDITAAPATDAFGQEIPGAPSGLSGNVALGFVNGSVVDGTVNPETGQVENTSFTVDFTVDINDDSFVTDPDAFLIGPNQALFDRVTHHELLEKIDQKHVPDVLTPQIDVDGQIRLHFETDTGSLPGYSEQQLGFIDGSLGLPEIAFDLNVDASISHRYFSLPNQFVTIPDIDHLAFNNVTLDVTPLLNGIVTPMANLVGGTLGPLFNVFGVGLDAGVGFLNAPLPILDVIGPAMGFGQPSILSLSGVGDKLNPLFSAVGDIVGLPADITDFLQSYNGDPINFGSYEYDFDAAPNEPKFNRTQTSLAGTIDSEVFTSLYGERLQRGGFNLDIIEPGEILDMLIGNPFDIVSYNLPAISLDLSGDFGFDFKALNFGIHAGANLDLKPIRFVYDSSGLETIVDATRAGVIPDYKDLLDGFYIRNSPGREFNLSLDIGGGGGVDIGVFFANANTSLAGDLFFDLQDPNEDGKLRLNEIFAVTDQLSSPQNVINLFDAGIDIDGSFDFSGGFRIFLLLKTITQSVSLSGLGIPSNINLGLSLSDVLGYSVSEQPEGEPSLGTEFIEAGQKVLRINAGLFADDRVHGSTNDSGGIDVSGRDGSIIVTANLPGQGLVTQSFDANVDRVVIVGTENNDRIDFSGLSNVALEVHGLGGDDTILTGGGNDLIFAGAGNDIVHAGAGDDIVLGEDGDDTIFGEAGADVIDGGHGNDTINGGSDNDVITGGWDDDLLISVAGIDQVFGDRGDDIIQIDHRSQATIDGGRGFNTLLINDAQNDFNSDRPLTATLTANTFDVIGGSTSTYSDIDFVDVSLGSLADVLTIHSTSSSVRVDGIVGLTESDSLIIDRTHDTVDRNGVLIGDTITGLGLNDITYTNIENLEINLGSGSDNFTVESTSELTATTINSGLGDDTITLKSVGSTKLTQIIGNDGSDEAILLIPDNPSEFGQLGVGVERLVIDNSTAGDSVSWEYSDGRIQANGNPIVDALGAELVVFTAGLGGADSLVVEDNVDNPQFITIENDQVQILEGINLLQQNAAQNFSFDTTQFPTSAQGIAGARGITDSPDGNHVYVTGGSHIAVYRRQLDVNGNRTQNLEFIQVLVDGINGVDGLHGAQDVVVSPDGRHVYVASFYDQKIAIFERVSETGRLIYRSQLHMPGQSFTGITMGLNSRVYAIAGGFLTWFERDLTDGQIRVGGLQVPGGTLTDITVTPDGGEVYVTTQNGIHRYDVHLNGHILVDSQLTPGESLFLGQSIYSPNGAVRLTLQHDGNLVLHDVSFPAPRLLWQLVTQNTGVVRATMQTDGNFVLYRADGFAVWDSQTAGHNGLRAVVEDDGIFKFRNPANVEIVSARGRLGQEYSFADRADSFPYKSVTATNQYVYVGTSTGIRRYDRNLNLINTKFSVRGTDVSTLAIHEPSGTLVAGFDTRTTRPIGTDQLIGNQDFHLGQSIYSENGAVRLTLQPDGNLVIFNLRDTTGNPVIWSLGTQGSGAAFLRMQTDGNLVLYSAGGASVVWNSGTFDPGNPAVRARIQNDGNFVLYRANGTIAWVTNSVIPPAPYEPLIPAEIQVFDGALNPSIFNRSDPGGINGPTTIQDITMTSDGVSYSIDPSLASLYVSHAPNSGDTLREGQPQNQSLNKAGEADAKTVVYGNTAYTLSSKLGTLTITDATTGANRGRVIISGILTAGSIAVSDNGHFLYITNPTEDSLLIYNLDSAGNVSGAPRVLTDGVSGADGLDGVNQIEIVGDRLFVSSPVENTLAIYAGANSGALTFHSKTSTGLNGPTHITTSVDGLHVYVSSEHNHILAMFQVAGNSLVPVQFITNGVDGVVNMGSPQTSILSHDERFLYVGSGDDSIAIFARDTATGQLTFVDSIRNGVKGIQGLDGLSSLALSGNDDYLFAAGADADTIAVFTRDTGTGKIRFVQRVRNGSAGVIGLNNPTDLNIVGNQLLITTGGEAGPLNENGSLAYLQIDTSLPKPNAYRATYTGVESLTVRSADAPDQVSIRDIVIETTVETKGGNDDVVIHHAPAGLSTTVNLGADNDSVVLRESGDGAQVYLNGESGDDTLTVFSVGSGTTTVLNSGTGTNLFVVDGTTLGATLQLDGHESGIDTLQLDTKGITPPSNPNRVDGPTSDDGIHFEPNGSIVVTGESFGINYTSINEISRVAAPTAAVGGPYSIVEGNGLSLDASGTIAPALGGPVSYSWDINGDGQFGDVIGLSPVITGETLIEFGIDDNGTYQIAVRATNSEGSDEAFTTLTVHNIDPILNLVGDSSSTQYVSYVLDLSATDPGDDTISEYMVDWGDGSSTTLTNEATTRLLHTYTTSGNFTITVNAIDEDGGPYTATNDVNVIAGPPPTRTLSGAASLNESESFALTLTSAGPGTVASWLVNWGDGTTSMLNSASGLLNHIYADDGVYQVSAIVTDSNGATSLATNSLNVRVENIAPTVTYSGTSSAVEGSQYSIQNISATDPGVDTINQWIVEWGDGQISLVNPNETNAAHIYLDDGSYTVRVGARDEDGIFVSTNEVTVTASNVTPTLTLSGDSLVDEGSVYTLNLSDIDPGNDTISAWHIDWGDGTSTNGVPGEIVSGNPASITHVYADGDNQYTITATAVDEDGTHTASNTVTVNVQDVSPTPTVNGNTLITEGAQIEINLTSNDPGLDLVNSWTIDWGDGTTPDVLPGDALSAVHTYADDGEYNIVATVNNSDGAFASDPHVVTVFNVAPTIIIAGEVQSDSTQPFKLTLGNVIDPGDDTVLEYRVDWGDGSIFPDSDGDGDDDTFETFTSNGVIEHTFEDGNGAHLIVVTLVDEDGTFPVAATLLTVNEGSLAPLRLSALTAPENPGDPESSYIIEWGDGTSNTYTNADALPNDDGLLLIDVDHIFRDSGIHNTKVFIKHPSSSDPILVRELPVVVNNINPVITRLETNSFKLGEVVLSEQTTISADFTDLGSLDTHTASIDWGDGTDLEWVPVNELDGSGTLNGNHAYALPGTYTITLTLTDDDGGTTQAEVTAIIAGTGLFNGTLSLVGTNGNDNIHVFRFFQKYVVIANIFSGFSVRFFNVSDVQKISVVARDGNDHVHFSNNVSVPAILRGGDGHDSLIGGSGNDTLLGENGHDYLSGGNGDNILVGGDGNDWLRGGRGRDILIGGQGRDDIKGGSGDDILIGGFTSFDTNLDALNAISNEWNSRASYQTRINNLQTGVGSDLVALKANGPDATIFDDGERDTLKGERGRDWFLGDSDDDRIRKRRDEVFTHIDILDLI
ncbi:Bifunctional hemolysin/adenylate cyclase precursor [Gimesia maris]|uniref:PKD domain-containing protein n=1 Tax=Gimesia maris TaxID=122 RepID=UPI00118C24DD|nr:PKD domain-containing protein [Gimesia maris]QDT78225.1 Bifunctional hemolysin/adenylate cyclase precursor [Gimesia maris]